MLSVRASQCTHHPPMPTSGCSCKEVLQQKRLAFSVRWVPAHATDFSDLSNSVSPLVVHGNAVADDLAKQAAREYPMSDKVVADVEAEFELCGYVLKRIATIAQVFADATPKVRRAPAAPRPVKPSVLEQIAAARENSQH